MFGHYLKASYSDGITVLGKRVAEKRCGLEMAALIGSAGADPSGLYNELDFRRIKGRILKKRWNDSRRLPAAAKVYREKGIPEWLRILGDKYRNSRIWSEALKGYTEDRQTDSLFLLAKEAEDQGERKAAADAYAAAI